MHDPTHPRPPPGGAPATPQHNRLPSSGVGGRKALVRDSCAGGRKTTVARVALADPAHTATEPSLPGMHGGGSTMADHHYGGATPRTPHTKTDSSRATAHHHPYSIHPFFAPTSMRRLPPTLGRSAARSEPPTHRACIMAIPSSTAMFLHPYLASTMSCFLANLARGCAVPCHAPVIENDPLHPRNCHHNHTLVVSSSLRLHHPRPCIGAATVSPPADGHPFPPFRATIVIPPSPTGTLSPSCAKTTPMLAPHQSSDAGRNAKPPTPVSSAPLPPPSPIVPRLMVLLPVEIGCVVAYGDCVC